LYGLIFPVVESCDGDYHLNEMQLPAWYTPEVRAMLVSLRGTSPGVCEEFRKRVLVEGDRRFLRSFCEGLQRCSAVDQKGNHKRPEKATATKSRRPGPGAP
jgi:hypothetical protein